MYEDARLPELDKKEEEEKCMKKKEKTSGFYTRRINVYDVRIRM